jgi:hypothetical protein
VKERGRGVRREGCLLSCCLSKARPRNAAARPSLSVLQEASTATMTQLLADTVVVVSAVVVELWQWQPGCDSDNGHNGSDSHEGQRLLEVPRAIRSTIRSYRIRTLISCNR